MKLSSPDFLPSGPIPQVFTGEGRDRSPTLEWTDLPEGTHRLALICEDPDAPVRSGKDHPFVHWVIYNISAQRSGLPEGLGHSEHLTEPLSAEQGVNSWGNRGYGGPMPPEGHGRHRYVFTLFALDHQILFPTSAQANKETLLAAMRVHTLGRAEYIGTYQRGEKSVRVA